MDMRKAMMIVEAAQVVDEAPLADFATFGDLDQEGSMRGDDLRAVRSEKWLKKVHSQFANFPHSLNVYVYNGEGGNVQIGDTTVNAKALEHLNKFSGVQPLSTIEKMIGKLPPDAERSITAILIENEGDGRLPLTPWILAHRICHAIIDAALSSGNTKDSQISAAYYAMNWKYGEIIGKTMQRLEATDEYENHFYAGGARSSENNKRVAKLIGTMNSARSGGLTNGGEFQVELMAQVMIQGKVTFNCPEISSDPQYGSKIKERIDVQARELTGLIGEVFEACIGKAVLL